MQNTNTYQNVWELLISRNTFSPIDFQQLADQYQINKLSLQQITASQLRSKKMELAKRTMNFNDETSRTWAQNQYRIFMWFCLSYFQLVNKKLNQISPQDWELIGNIFSKQACVCQYFFKCLKKAKTQAWTKQQDNIISGLMKSQMNKKWTNIAVQLFKATNHVSIRKPKAVRQRWLSHLNPEINKSGWQIEQEILLIQKVREYGKKWSKIASLMKCRSQHTVKNRYNKLLIAFKKKWPEIQDECDQNQIVDFIYDQLTNKHQAKIQKQNKAQSKVQQSSLVAKPQISNQYLKLEVQQVTQIQAKQSLYFQPIIIYFSGSI